MCPNTEQVVCSLQGVLAQGQNGDELFCEKFHAANGKAQTCSQGALIYFLLRGEGDLSSQRVPIRFPICHKLFFSQIFLICFLLP
jgi:hypothetical protein